MDCPCCNCDHNFWRVYFHESHAVASDVPGHVYRYDNSSNDRVLLFSIFTKR